MSKGDQIHIKRHLDIDELNYKIKTEKNAKVLKRLYFIKFRYEGDKIKEAVEKIGITKRVGYIWQDRWNEEGYEGLSPRYAGGRPSKLTDIQKIKLEEMLRQKDSWTSREIRDLIIDEFEVTYTIKQILIIAKKMGMKHAKPFQHDYRRPRDAANILKKTR